MDGWIDILESGFGWIFFFFFFFFFTPLFKNVFIGGEEKKYKKSTNIDHLFYYGRIAKTGFDINWILLQKQSDHIVRIHSSQHNAIVYNMKLY